MGTKKLKKKKKNNTDKEIMIKLSDELYTVHTFMNNAFVINDIIYNDYFEESYNNSNMKTDAILFGFEKNRVLSSIMIDYLKDGIELLEKLLKIVNERANN